MPTYEDALAHLGIDYDDDLIKRNVAHKLAAAIKAVRGAVGDDVEILLPDDERVRELVLTFLDDLYSQRGTAAKVTGATRRAVSTMVLQLQTELQRLREGEDV